MSAGAVAFSSIAPRFEVLDVSIALGHYGDILGFQSIDIVGNPPVYATMSRGAVEIHLRIGSRPSEAYIWVERLEDLVAELHAHAITFSGPFDRQGLREIVVSDPWGNSITFGSNIVS